MGSADVLEATYPLIPEREKPTSIRSDYGRAFTAKALQTWISKVCVPYLQIYPDCY
ncbi:MAG: hypothetical protein AAGH38_00285 [Pseudomonadota bacterium]